MTWPFEHRWCTVCQHLRPHQLSTINNTSMWECTVCLEEEIELMKKHGTNFEKGGDIL